MLSRDFFTFAPAKNMITMSEALDKIVSESNQLMKKAIGHLETELLKIRAGKATPQIVEGIFVEYYGNPTPLNQVANITIPDARTISLQPWEKNMMQAIEKAIIASNIGLNPQNDGTYIRLFLPPLTEERRRELVKRVNNEGEEAKIAIRSIRRDLIEQIKKLQKDGLSEDEAKDGETRVQAVTDKHIALIEVHLKDKEKDIMTI